MDKESSKAKDPEEVEETIETSSESFVLDVELIQRAFAVHSDSTR